MLPASGFLPFVAAQGAYRRTGRISPMLRTALHASLGNLGSLGSQRLLSLLTCPAARAHTLVFRQLNGIHACLHSHQPTRLEHRLPHGQLAAQVVWLVTCGRQPINDSVNGCRRSKVRAL